MSGDPHRPFIVAGLLLGAGLGGFADGIVFHQLLQWHNMFSARLPPDNLLNAKVNMFWDGVFHAAVWLLTVIGLWRLHCAATRAHSMAWPLGARRHVLRLGNLQPDRRVDRPPAAGLARCDGCSGQPVARRPGVSRLRCRAVRARRMVARLLQGLKKDARNRTLKTHGEGFLLRAG